MVKMRYIVLLAAIGVLLAGCTSPQTETPTRSVITLSGTGQVDTAKYTMSGDYTVKWQTLHDCVYYVNLEPGLVDVFSATAALTGTGNVHGLTAGDYYFHVITGPTPECGWSVTLTPVN